ncbi:Beta-galactosidase [Desulfosporosinus sp. I2]|uniref:glycosyl hydrolase n=1 Tax=Desulfosporosinus sp. I2 TaxID=1617025 RepID=UPI0005EF77F6|nr:glycosyl hydrolase [Desulfosporosinus sp. I2]KJR45706.1 Beta-galactosidase [Desulfosporosinus sp. I2]
MFNRRLMIFIALWALTMGTLWWYWRNVQGESLQAGQSGISATRFMQNLNGSWDQFSSLRQAWTTESERIKGINNQSFLTGGKLITLPSSERFRVVAKRVRIPGEWSSRTMLLTMNSVQGHASVYLNGISSSQKIGEFEGSGGADEIEIPAKAFRYGEDNILIIELAGSAGQRATFLGSAWPRSGRITGDFRLNAVVETTIMPPQVRVAWTGTTAQITVESSLQLRGFSQDGPWTVNGVLSDGSAGVAEQTITLEPQEKVDNRPVTLTFSVPDARRWTLEDPYLYQLHLTVTNSKADMDDLALPIGLRTIAFSAGKWVLNDQVIPIMGKALMPQDEYKLRHTEQVEAWLRSERQKGVNLIYFIGQSPDELWLQAADRVGMGLWAELPVELIPSHRLPQPIVFRKNIKEKMLHPSLWAWTVGKGLDSDNLAKTYLQQAVKEVQPNLAFALETTHHSISDFSEEQLLVIQGNNLQGDWGQVTVETPSLPRVLWVNEAIAAGVWALLMFYLAWMNLRSTIWRYKEIGEKKPKRRLRRAWLWDGLFVFAREGMLAGLVTSGIFRIPIHISPWFSHLWPRIELVQAQSPWLVWEMLTVLFMLIRLLQVGVVSPHMPDAPHAVGLVYWLERRYRWAVFIAIGWASFPWGVPFYFPILGYTALVILFLPIRVRDIHRVGGHYLPFLWVPGIMAGSVLVWASFYVGDWIYLWHMLSESIFYWMGRG